MNVSSFTLFHSQFFVCYLQEHSCCKQQSTVTMITCCDRRCVFGATLSSVSLLPHEAFSLFFSSSVRLDVPPLPFSVAASLQVQAWHALTVEPMKVSLSYFFLVALNRIYPWCIAHSQTCIATQTRLWFTIIPTAPCSLTLLAVPGGMKSSKSMVKMF